MPARLAEYQRELGAVPSEERRERLEWQIRRAQKRATDLAKLSAETPA